MGNIRVSFNDTDKDGKIDVKRGSVDIDGDGDYENEIVEEHNYYPYGLKHKGYNNVVNGRKHNYAFGGKEYQDEKDLAWYDVSARNYDPALGRWMNIDPLAEEMRRHSPYNYAFDNPVFFIDPDGMAPQGPDWIKNGDGTYTAEAGDSAWTLAEDAGITYERAQEIMANTYKSNSEGNNMGTYTDQSDKVLKSKVDEGDIVAIPEQVNDKVSETKADNVVMREKVKKVEAIRQEKKDAVTKLDKKIDSTSKEVKKYDNRYKSHDMVIKITKLDPFEKAGTEIQAAHGVHKVRNERDSVKSDRHRKKLKKSRDSIFNILYN